MWDLILMVYLKKCFNQNLELLTLQKGGRWWKTCYADQTILGKGTHLFYHLVTVESEMYWKSDPDKTFAMQNLRMSWADQGILFAMYIQIFKYWFYCSNTMAMNKALKHSVQLYMTLILWSQLVCIHLCIFVVYSVIYFQCNLFLRELFMFPKHTVLISVYRTVDIDPKPIGGTKSIYSVTQIEVCLIPLNFKLS